MIGHFTLDCLDGLCVGASSIWSWTPTVAPNDWDYLVRSSPGLQLRRVCRPRQMVFTAIQPFTSLLVSSTCVRSATR